MVLASMREAVHALSAAATPNPSLKRSTTGRPQGPGLWHTVHFYSAGPGGLPVASA